MKKMEIRFGIMNYRYDSYWYRIWLVRCSFYIHSWISIRGCVHPSVCPFVHNNNNNVIASYGPWCFRKVLRSICTGMSYVYFYSFLFAISSVPRIFELCVWILWTRWNIKLETQPSQKWTTTTTPRAHHPSRRVFLSFPPFLPLLWMQQPKKKRNVFSFPSC